MLCSERATDLSFGRRHAVIVLEKEPCRVCHAIPLAAQARGRCHDVQMQRLDRVETDVESRLTPSGHAMRNEETLDFIAVKSLSA